MEFSTLEIERQKLNNIPCRQWLSLLPSLVLLIGILPNKGGTCIGEALLFLGIFLLQSLTGRHFFGFSLEDGAVGYHLGNGNVSVANLQHFYPDSNITIIPDMTDQSFVAKLYTDISISYTETNSSNLGPGDDYELEDLGNGWRYHVCLAIPHAKFKC